MKNLVMALLSGGAGAVAGAVLTYVAAVAVLELLPSGGPDWRTGSAFTAFFLGIFGGLGGLVAGLIFASMAQAGQAMVFWKGLGMMASVAVAIVLVGGLVLVAGQDRAPRLAGKALDLEYEFRLPRGYAWPPAGVSATRQRVAFYRPKYSVEYPLNLGAATQEEGRWVLRGRFPMDVSPKEMTLAFYLDDATGEHFGLDPRTPEAVDLDWFPWVWSQKKPLETSFNFRYRYVQRP